jgi:hypothetical protein
VLCRSRAHQGKAPEVEVWGRMSSLPLKGGLQHQKLPAPDSMAAQPLPGYEDKLEDFENLYEGEYLRT